MIWIKVQTPESVCYLGYQRMVDTLGVAGEYCGSEFPKRSASCVEKELRKRYDTVTRINAWNRVIIWCEGIKTALHDAPQAPNHNEAMVEDRPKFITGCDKMTERIYSNIHMVGHDTRTQFYPRNQAWIEVFNKAAAKGFKAVNFVEGSELFTSENVLSYDDKIGIQWSWEWRIDNP